MKVPLADQILAVEFEAVYATEVHRDLLEAAAATLKWVERHQAEIRVLGEFPGAEIRVLTPQATGGDGC